MPVAGPLEIVSLDNEARGVGRLSNEDGTPGKVVFVEGALPGERVTYRSHRPSRPMSRPPWSIFCASRPRA